MMDSPHAEAMPERRCKCDDQDPGSCNYCRGQASLKLVRHVGHSLGHEVDETAVRVIARTLFNAGFYIQRIRTKAEREYDKREAGTWDESDCPLADVILTTSNSSDPASDHYADQSRLYSNKEWLRFPFCDSDIETHQIGETLILQE